MMVTDELVNRFENFGYFSEDDEYKGMSFDLVARKDAAPLIGFYVLVKFVDFIDGTTAETWKKHFDYIKKKSTGAMRNNSFIICLITEKSTPAAKQVLYNYHPKRGAQALGRIYLVVKDTNQLLADIPMVFNKPALPGFQDVKTILSDALYMHEI